MGRKLDHATALYMEGIRDGHPREAIAKYSGDRYTQHSTGVADGQEGFIAFFEDFIERCPVRDIRIVRGFEDGQYVFVHAFQDINDGDAMWDTMDIFDTDERDRMIEHWDVISAHSLANRSDNSSTNGATDITDEHLTDQNKATIRELIQTVLSAEGDPGRLDDYVAADLVEHAAGGTDGIEAFRGRLTAPHHPLVFDENVLLVGRGSFVAALSKATMEGEPWARMDLFRLQDGKVVEHWEVAEPVPTPEVAKNGGKF